MIHINGREITLVINNNLFFAAIYKGLQLVWQAISSCFGKGYWRNDKPWLNNEGWANDTNGIVIASPGVVVPPAVVTCATPVIHVSPDFGIVVIVSSTSGAEIHYTLDGTDPDIDSPTYTDVLNVTGSGTVKAIAVKNGCIDSQIASADFNILSDFDRYYIPLEYVRSNGDANISLSSPIGAHPKLVFENLIIITNNVSLFHVVSSGSPKNGCWGCNPDSTFYYNYCTGSWTNSSVPFALNTPMTVAFSNKIIVNGSEKLNLAERDFSAYANERIRLFGVGYGNAGICLGHTIQYNGDTIVHDLYPAKSRSNGVAGLYDKVTQTFFPSTGFGLIAGPTLSQ